MSKSLLDQVQIKSASSKSSKNPTVVLAEAQASQVDALVNVTKQVKELEAEKSTLNSEVKDIGQQVYAEQAAKGQFDNTRLQGVEASVLFIVQSTYNAVSEEKREMLIAEGFGEYVERDQIALKGGLSEEVQGRIIKALVDEFGKDEALSLFEAKFKIKEGALEDVAKQSKDPATILRAIKLLEPRQQIRT